MAPESSWTAVRTRFRSAWDEAEAAKHHDDLELRAWSSRLLGADASLVMQGGGNTSVKGAWADGRACVWVKGTGADLAFVGSEHFTPVDESAACDLLDGPPLDNAGLATALQPLELAPSTPRPSIETLMHAFLPGRFVEHTHADSVLALLDTESAEDIVARVFGDIAPLVPFRHSGFELALACRDTFVRRATAGTTGLLLASHGAVAFADDARTSYERMGALVTRAEDWLVGRGAWALPRAESPPRDANGAKRLAALRLALSRIAGFPVAMIVDAHPEASAFARRPDLEILALQGPPTPQHAIFTKRIPALDFDVAGYAAVYRTYLAEHGAPYPTADLPDPAPRVLIDPAFGVISTSTDARQARIVAEIVVHDIAIATRAAGHDRYRALPPADILAAEVHYGGHERRKLARRATDLPLLGCITLAAGTVDSTVLKRLTTLGADVISVGDLTDPVLVDAVYDHGGVDVVITARPAASGLLDHVLAHSPAGGLACAPGPHDSLFDRIVDHWQRSLSTS
jgi:rhamnose utilization protein RhaD (predicted bifunctional aldolase and dehydrogenase)